MHFCSQCGAALPSDARFCPTCASRVKGDTEIADKSTDEAKSAIRLFAERINELKTNKEKIELIKGFPIPDSLEGIVELFMLASSSFDSEFYAKHLNIEDVSDAWLNKLKGCFEKAKMLFPGEPVLTQMEVSVNRINSDIDSAKRRLLNIEAAPEEEKKGFGSWSASQKALWILLNICAFGIPALIYLVIRKASK